MLVGGLLLSVVPWLLCVLSTHAVSFFYAAVLLRSASPATFFSAVWQAVLSRHAVSLFRAAFLLRSASPATFFPVVWRAVLVAHAVSPFHAAVLLRSASCAAVFPAVLSTPAASFFCAEILLRSLSRALLLGSVIWSSVSTLVGRGRAILRWTSSRAASAVRGLHVTVSSKKWLGAILAPTHFRETMQS